MGKGAEEGGGGGHNHKSSSQKVFKDRAKNRLDDLQDMFADLQSARIESRTIDVAVLEEQVHQMLREWKAELNEPSPATSLQDGSLSFSSELYRLLHAGEVEDDATSPLATALKGEPNTPKVDDGTTVSEKGFGVNIAPQQDIHPDIECRGYSSVQNMGVNGSFFTSQLEYDPCNSQQYSELLFSGFDGTEHCGGDDITRTDAEAYMNISPSAFLGPKCALWDCTRPAQGADRCQDYCSMFHITAALNEGHPGMAPVVRPKGIFLKDNLLFAALSAKAQGKDVGIPECQGAASTKSPWNAPELFDLAVAEGETIREWLFFDKPRRAFESGTRKQRSLPDYPGRGWHESRKQVMKESEGLKRSYYMDPQPSKDFEWHLFEYEINNHDTFALYRLEFKLSEGKKGGKSKVTAADPVADLQKQMGRLTAEFPSDNNKPSVKGRVKATTAKNGVGNFSFAAATNQIAAPMSEGQRHDNNNNAFTVAVSDYLVDDQDGYYQT